MHVYDLAMKRLIADCELRIEDATLIIASDPSVIAKIRLQAPSYSVESHVPYKGSNDR